MLLAATRPDAVGQAFIVSYGNGVTWKDFFGYYARMLNIKLPNLSLEMIHQQQRQIESLSDPFNIGLSFAASPHAQSVIREIPLVGPGFKIAINAIPNSYEELN
jgi:hypothetical protein